MNICCCCGRRVVTPRVCTNLNLRIDRGLGTSMAPAYYGEVCRACSSAFVRMFWAVENVYIRLMTRP